MIYVDNHHLSKKNIKTCFVGENIGCSVGYGIRLHILQRQVNEIVVNLISTSFYYFQFRDVGLYIKS